MGHISKGNSNTVFCATSREKCTSWLRLLRFGHGQLSASGVGGEAVAAFIALGGIAAEIGGDGIRTLAWFPVLTVKRHLQRSGIGAVGAFRYRNAVFIQLRSVLYRPQVEVHLAGISAQRIGRGLRPLHGGRDGDRRAVGHGGDGLPILAEAHGHRAGEGGLIAVDSAAVCKRAALRQDRAVVGQGDALRNGQAGPIADGHRGPRRDGDVAGQGQVAVDGVGAVSGGLDALAVVAVSCPLAAANI